MKGKVKTFGTRDGVLRTEDGEEFRFTTSTNNGADQRMPVVGDEISFVGVRDDAGKYALSWHFDNDPAPNAEPLSHEEVEYLHQHGCL